MEHSLMASRVRISCGATSLCYASAGKASVSRMAYSLAMKSSFVGDAMEISSGINLMWIDGKRIVRVRAGDAAKKVVHYETSYAVPMDNHSSSSFITRPLAEIMRDMNKRVPEKVLMTRMEAGVEVKFIPWYHANRMLSFYAPGWSGEVRSITYSNDGKSVTVVYRVTIRGTDGEAWREASGTANLKQFYSQDSSIQEAEGLAFCKACARFGLGLYLYHEDLSTL